MPEVILPAYGCPDLVSACVHAGVKPVLVDLDPDSCWMSLGQIESHISPRTIAIIAVRFLGIAERMEQLRQMCRSRDLLLIEDSAQGFPLFQPDHYWQGDVIVLSFGRGKPVNLLGGGALLYKNDKYSNYIPAQDIQKSDAFSNIRYALKVSVYNLLINPFAFGLATRLPGIQVGETVYKPLSSIEGIHNFVLQRLNANILLYRRTSNIAGKLSDLLNKHTLPNIVDLPTLAKHDIQNPLLRYPVLFRKKKLRDCVFHALAPYGASLMYQKPLPTIETVPKSLEFIGKNFENAEDFADRLLTLPTHSGVNSKVIEIITRALLETN